MASHGEVSGREPPSSLRGRAGAVGEPGSMSPALVLLFAVASGLAVANITISEPLLEVIGRDLGFSHAALGVVGAAAQVGYALGLIFIVPLGDLVDPRRLVILQQLLSAGALLVVSLAWSAHVLLAAMAIVGLLAVVTQVLVAFAARLAPAAERGRVVGAVTSGVIIGILVARVISGAVTDTFGWRGVYIASAATTLVVAVLLLIAVPTRAPAALPMSYGRLVASTFTLFLEEAVLRIRATIALLIFAANTMLWTPLVLPLTAPPYSLSKMEVGAFGLAGIMGALGAASAGRLADRGLAQRTTFVGLCLMLISWYPTFLLPQSLWGLAAGAMMVTFGLQSVHVSNQSLIYRTRPDARSRLVAAYMICYSVGSATGAILATTVYARAGWSGVCVVAATINAAALTFWVVTRRK